MQLDPDTCFRAVSSRDRRFDGKFFIGITSTRIYCRPVCPARHAKRCNMEFYPTAAAAEAAGYRPCLRCFPEYSPAYVAANDGQEVIKRALQLIATGELDENGVTGVAKKLGISDRHLRRLFADHLGATPLAFAQTRRVQFAKQLIADTKLTMTKIAFASGFQTIRQFNGAFKQLYGRTPIELRRSSRTGEKSACAPIHMKLAYRPPFNWEPILDFLQPRLQSGIEAIEGQTYRRFVTFEDESGIVEIRHCPDRHSLELAAPSQLWHHARALVEQTRRMFDLDADPMTIGEHLRSDQDLSRLIGPESCVRVLGGWEPFSDAIRIILGQQVSVAGATTLCARLIRQFGKQFSDDQLGWAFPKPSKLAAADTASIGIPKSRAIAIKEFSSAVARRWIVLDGTMGLVEFLDRTTSLPGIGKWTANCIAMRSLKEPNAFPAGDLGIRKAMSPGLRNLVTEKKVELRAASWQPWRSYAAMALWQSPKH